jgi:hypothetical protein
MADTTFKWDNPYSGQLTGNYQPVKKADMIKPKATPETPGFTWDNPYSGQFTGNYQPVEKANMMTPASPEDQVVNLPAGLKWHANTGLINTDEATTVRTAEEQKAYQETLKPTPQVESENSIYNNPYSGYFGGNYEPVVQSDIPNSLDYIPEMEEGQVRPKSLLDHNRGLDGTETPADIAMIALNDIPLPIGQFNQGVANLRPKKNDATVNVDGQDYSYDYLNSLTEGDQVEEIWAIKDDNGEDIILPGVHSAEEAQEYDWFLRDDDMVQNEDGSIVLPRETLENNTTLYDLTPTIYTDTEGNQLELTDEKRNEIIEALEEYSDYGFGNIFKPNPDAPSSGNWGDFLPWIVDTALGSAPYMGSMLAGPAAPALLAALTVADTIPAMQGIDPMSYDPKTRTYSSLEMDPSQYIASLLSMPAEMAVEQTPGGINIGGGSTTNKNRKYRGPKGKGEKARAAYAAYEILQGLLRTLNIGGHEALEEVMTAPISEMEEKGLKDFGKVWDQETEQYVEGASPGQGFKNQLIDNALGGLALGAGMAIGPTMKASRQDYKRGTGQLSNKYTVPMYEDLKKELEKDKK